MGEQSYDTRPGEPSSEASSVEAEFRRRVKRGRETGHWPQYQRC